MNSLSNVDSPRLYRRRRILVAGLNIVTVATATIVMLLFLGADGMGPVEWLIFGCFTLTLPYTSIGFWNACIGLACRWLPGVRPPPDYGLADASHDGDANALATRIAVVVALRNEDPGSVFERLTAMRASLAKTGQAGAFQFVVLSDSDQPAVIDAESLAFNEFALEHHAGSDPIYRRRDINTGYKAGNIGEFLDAHGDRFDFFVPLDADSFVSGPVLVRMARAMAHCPKLGILQSLVVGTPTTSGFARIFQFGMRHAMRSFSTGAAWWTGDCGPYWGHNAIIRVEPFRAHCRMPRLPGRTPLSGVVMSHDQLEAAFMRRAGFEVRVAPVETDSYEINPPNLLEFIRREKRWCQGNLQYVFLIAARGLKTISRVQLVLAMLMYIGPPAWITMTVLACAGGLSGALHTGSFVLGVSLFGFVLTLALAPKIIGALDVALSEHARRAYAGAGRFALSVSAELLVSVIMAPIVAVSITLFIVGLICNRPIGWTNAGRDTSDVAWRRAAWSMLPHTAFGLALGWIVVSQAGAVALAIACPFIGGLSLSIPFTVLSARTSLGRYCAARGLFTVPEETRRPLSIHPVDAT